MVNNVRELLNKFVKLEHELEKKGISTKDIVSGYGEYLASKKLNLRLNENPNFKGYDGKDSDGKKYQIKTVRNKTCDFSVVFDFHNAKKSDFDHAILISLDKDFDINFIVKLSAKYILSNLGIRGRFTLSKKLIQKLKELEQIKILKIKKWIKKWYQL